MSIPPFPDRRTPEEIHDYERKCYEELWFEPGRTYEYKLGSHWVDGFGYFRLEDWTCYVQQAECPWMLIASQSFEFRRGTGGGIIAKERAIAWGKAYLKRGGPPDDHWAKLKYEQEYGGR